ncbi:uncharacterized protein LOC125379341 isoform X2 [Haliotis rufescens]|uniref:uncharacterized protein LOC125379341 isoform X2 n=1 Tax=Haliotis rufescens TaxID=6454 RepID=UPI00201F9C58|nr:uncharacterized protein LOC125379341 isoform X2 [Haliotis rufescens]
MFLGLSPYLCSLVSPASLRLCVSRILFVSTLEMKNWYTAFLKMKMGVAGTNHDKISRPDVAVGRITIFTDSCLKLTDGSDPRHPGTGAIWNDGSKYRSLGIYFENPLQLENNKLLASNAPVKLGDPPMLEAMVLSYRGNHSTVDIIKKFRKHLLSNANDVNPLQLENNKLLAIDVTVKLGDPPMSEAMVLSYRGNHSTVDIIKKFRKHLLSNANDVNPLQLENNKLLAIDVTVKLGDPPMLEAMVLSYRGNHSTVDIIKKFRKHLLSNVNDVNPLQLENNKLLAIDVTVKLGDPPMSEAMVLSYRGNHSTVDIIKKFRKHLLSNVNDVNPLQLENNKLLAIDVTVKLGDPPMLEAMVLSYRGNHSTVDIIKKFRKHLLSNVNDVNPLQLENNKLLAIDVTVKLGDPPMLEAMVLSYRGNHSTVDIIKKFRKHLLSNVNDVNPLQLENNKLLAIDVTVKLGDPPMLEAMVLSYRGNHSTVDIIKKFRKHLLSNVNDVNPLQLENNKLLAIDVTVKLGDPPMLEAMVLSYRGNHSTVDIIKKFRKHLLSNVNDVNPLQLENNKLLASNAPVKLWDLQMSEAMVLSYRGNHSTVDINKKFRKHLLSNVYDENPLQLENNKLLAIDVTVKLGDPPMLEAMVLSYRGNHSTVDIIKKFRKHLLSNVNDVNPLQLENNKLLASNAPVKLWDLQMSEAMVLPYGGNHSTVDINKKFRKHLLSNVYDENPLQLENNKLLASNAPVKLWDLQMSEAMVLPYGGNHSTVDINKKFRKHLLSNVYDENPLQLENNKLLASNAPVKLWDLQMSEAMVLPYGGNHSTVDINKKFRKHLLSNVYDENPLQLENNKLLASNAPVKLWDLQMSEAMVLPYGGNHSTVDINKKFRKHLLSNVYDENPLQLENNKLLASNAPVKLWDLQMSEAMVLPYGGNHSTVDINKKFRKHLLSNVYDENPLQLENNKLLASNALVKLWDLQMSEAMVLPYGGNHSTVDINKKFRKHLLSNVYDENPLQLENNKLLASNAPVKLWDLQMSEAMVLPYGGNHSTVDINKKFRKHLLSNVYDENPLQLENNKLLASNAPVKLWDLQMSEAMVLPYGGNHSTVDINKKFRKHLLSNVYDENPLQLENNKLLASNAPVKLWDLQMSEAMVLPYGGNHSTVDINKKFRKHLLSNVYDENPLQLENNKLLASNAPVKLWDLQMSEAMVLPYGGNHSTVDINKKFRKHLLSNVYDENPLQLENNKLLASNAPVKLWDLQMSEAMVLPYGGNHSTVDINKKFRKHLLSNVYDENPLQLENNKLLASNAPVKLWDLQMSEAMVLPYGGNHSTVDINKKFRKHLLSNVYDENPLQLENNKLLASNAPVKLWDLQMSEAMVLPYGGNHSTVDINKKFRKHLLSNVYDENPLQLENNKLLASNAPVKLWDLQMSEAMVLPYGGNHSTVDINKKFRKHLLSNVYDENPLQLENNKLLASNAPVKLWDLQMSEAMVLPYGGNHSTVDINKKFRKHLLSNVYDENPLQLENNKLLASNAPVKLWDLQMSEAMVLPYGGNHSTVDINKKFRKHLLSNVYDENPLQLENNKLLASNAPVKLWDLQMSEAMVLPYGGNHSTVDINKKFRKHLLSNVYDENPLQLENNKLLASNAPVKLWDLQMSEAMVLPYGGNHSTVDINKKFRKHLLSNVYDENPLQLENNKLLASNAPVKLWDLQMSEAMVLPYGGNHSTVDINKKFRKHLLSNVYDENPLQLENNKLLASNAPVKLWDLQMSEAMVLPYGGNHSTVDINKKFRKHLLSNVYDENPLQLENNKLLASNAPVKLWDLQMSEAMVLPYGGNHSTVDINKKFRKHLLSNVYDENPLQLENNKLLASNAPVKLWDLQMSEAMVLPYGGNHSTVDINKKFRKHLLSNVYDENPLQLENNKLLASNAPVKLWDLQMSEPSVLPYGGNHSTVDINKKFRKHLPAPEPYAGPPEFSIFTDSCGKRYANLSGIGGYLKVGSKYYIFSAGFENELDLHNNDLEMLPILVALKLWGSRMYGGNVLLYCDNQCTVNAINGRKRKKKSKAQEKMLELIRDEIESNNLHLRCEYIKGKNNRKADTLSRHPIEIFTRKLPQTSTYEVCNATPILQEIIRHLNL